MIDFVLNHLDELATLPGAVPMLRSFILDQAVRGNLTADWRQEHPDVEPASVLLERIREEKKELVKAGKIKKQKELPPVEPDEVSFEVPKTWEWVRLGSLAESVQYGYTASAVDDDSLTRFVRITDIQNGRVRWDTVPGCRIKDAQRPQYLLRSGDVLVARTGGTIGKTFLVESVPRASVFASYLIRVRCLGLHPDFLIHYLRSNAYWEQLYQFSKGTGQPNVNGTSLRQLYVPILDRREQSEIVHRIDVLMTLCDQLEAAQTHRENARRNALSTGAIHLTDDAAGSPFPKRWQSFSDRLPELVQHPDDTKPVQDAILQLAVRGHLTADWRAENPDVDPASVLLARIRAEKKELEKAGKIKKQKELPPVEADEVPFDVPESWEWVRLGDCHIIEMGTSPPGHTYNRERKGAPLINGPAEFEKSPYGAAWSSTFTTAGRSFCEPNDSLICVRGATTGRLNFAAHRACIGRGVAAVRSIVDQRFTHHFLLTARDDILASGRGVKFPAITKDQLFGWPFPMLPALEQSEIVRRVDNLMAVVDRLTQTAAQRNRHAETVLTALEKT